MHINAIRAYHVGLGKDDPEDKEGLKDVFIGEEIVSIHRISEDPKILRVVTALPVSGLAAVKDNKPKAKAKGKGKKQWKSTTAF